MKTAAAFFLASMVVAAQDPLKVAAKNYKVIAENENVRLLEANLPAGAKTAMHTHPALMAVILQASTTKWTMPDGKSEQSAPDAKRGSVIYMTAQSHVSENVGKGVTKAILVEFKKPAPSAAQAKKSSAQANCKVIADSPHATVQMCSSTPGSSFGAQHTHASDWVTVALTDSATEWTDTAGKKRPVVRKRDTAMLHAPETHTAANTGKTAAEVIVVDLK